MSGPPPRLAIRALIVERARVLLVNAYPGQQSDLLCLPGGGVEKHQSLHDNLRREVWEETGLTIEVGPLAGISEFHSSATGFHQVELIHRARIVARPKGDWQDVEGVVNRIRWADAATFESLRVKPDIVCRLAFDPPADVLYDPLEEIVG